MHSCNIQILADRWCSHEIKWTKIAINSNKNNKKQPLFFSLTNLYAKCKSRILIPKHFDHNNETKNEWNRTLLTEFISLILLTNVWYFILKKNSFDLGCKFNQQHFFVHQIRKSPCHYFDKTQKLKIYVYSYSIWWALYICYAHML